MRNVSQVHGNRVRESDSQRLVDVRALDTVGNSLTRFHDQPYCNNLLTQMQPSNTDSMLVEENSEKGGRLKAEHIRNPLQTQFNWQVVYCVRMLFVIIYERAMHRYY
jgi:hypothetical protein